MKLLFAIITFLLLLPPALSFAASYPASCPAEAQAIVDAVGGCSAIDPNQYQSIYNKCCSVNAVPTPQISPEEPTLESPDELTLESPEESASDSDAFSTPITILLSILFWGGLIYLVVWFVRKRKQNKSGVQ